MSTQIVKTVAALGLTLGRKTGKKVFQNYEAVLKTISDDTFNAAAHKLQEASDKGVIAKLKLSRNPFASVKDYVSIKFHDKFGIAQKVKLERSGQETITNFVQRVANETENIKKLIVDYKQDPSIVKSAKRGEYVKFFEGSQAHAILKNNLPANAQITFTRGSFWSGRQKTLRVIVPGQNGQSKVFQEAKQEQALISDFVKPNQAPNNLLRQYERAINPQGQYTYRQAEAAFEKTVKPVIERHLQEVQDKNGPVRKSWLEAIHKAKPRTFESAYEDITGKKANKAANEAYKAYDKVTAHRQRLQDAFKPVNQMATHSPSAAKFNVDGLKQSATRQYDDLAKQHSDKYQPQFEGQMNKRLSQYTRAQEGAKQEFAKREPLTKGQRLERERAKQIFANKQEHAQVSERAARLHQEQLNLQTKLDANNKAWKEAQAALKTQYKHTNSRNPRIRGAARQQIAALNQKKQELKAELERLTQQHEANQSTLETAQAKLEVLQNWLAGASINF